MPMNQKPCRCKDGKIVAKTWHEYWLLKEIKKIFRLNYNLFVNDFNVVWSWTCVVNVKVIF